MVRDLLDHGHDVLNFDRVPSPLGLPFERPPDYAPVDEVHVYPESSYALSKVLGEEMARQFHRWTGNFIFACLRGQELHRVVFKGGQIVHDEQLLVGRYGRLRDVVEGPRGALYVLTSNRDGRGRPRPGDDKILRIVPPRR